MGGTRSFKPAKAPIRSSDWWQPTRAEAATLLGLDVATVLVVAWGAWALWRETAAPLTVLMLLAVMIGAWVWFQARVRARCRREGVLGHGQVQLRRWSSSTEPRCAEVLGLPRSVGTAINWSAYFAVGAASLAAVVSLIR